MEEKIYDVAIVGGGIAGYSAALTLSNLKRDYLWVGDKLFGDKLLLAEEVRNFPTVTGNGMQFAQSLKEQMLKENLVFTQGKIDGVYALGEQFMLTQGQTVYNAKSVILASGVQSKGSVKNEEKFVGRGVSYCAVCDGALYQNKRIAVVITSPEYEHEGEYLAGFAQKLYAFCLYPSPNLKGENITLVEGLPLKVEGKERVQTLYFQGGEVEIDGLFLLKNSTPPSALVGGLEVENNHVKTGKRGETNLNGLFACGDVTGRPYQYLKGAGEGLVCAYSAHEYLLSLKK